jgi:hypothetical protein
MSVDPRHPIDEILAPLGRITPADRANGRSVERRHKLVGLLVAGVLLVVCIGATWGAYELTTASPDPTPDSPGGPLACLHLAGGTAGQAQDTLAARGYTVRWRLLRYGPDRTFVATEPHTVDPGAVVEDVELQEGSTVIVFVHLADDVNAPSVEPRACP